MTSPAPRQVLVASGNPDKFREISQALSSLGFTLLQRDQVATYPDPEETGDTLAENALIKAREGFAHTGVPSIADDTGLEVDWLDGRPGVFSSRYAGPDATYRDNVMKLLDELEDVPIESRTAVFRCVIAYTDGIREFTWEGVAPGVILEEPAGDSGFGYDPVFWSPELDMTFAQATLPEKNRVSHRGRALRAMAAGLKSYFKVS
jgi:XTP/dITP diphosphohydrolase